MIHTTRYISHRHKKSTRKSGACLRKMLKNIKGSMQQTHTPFLLVLNNAYKFSECDTIGTDASFKLIDIVEPLEKLAKSF